MFKIRKNPKTEKYDSNSYDQSLCGYVRSKCYGEHIEDRIDNTISVVSELVEILLEKGVLTKFDVAKLLTDEYDAEELAKRIFKEKD